MILGDLKRKLSVSATDIDGRNFCLFPTLKSYSFEQFGVVPVRFKERDTKRLCPKCVFETKI